MNIGDHVRALHSNEEGFITKIIDEKTIEIEIEDGFTMPLLKKDVVLVKKEESDFFDRGQEPQPTVSTIKRSIAHVGIYLSFIPSSEHFVDLHIINNTDYQLLLTAHTLLKGQEKGIFSNTLNSKSFILVNKWNINNFDHWEDLYIDMLFFQEQLTVYKSPISKKIKFQAKSFFNNLKQTPLINKKGYLYQIDQNAQAVSQRILSSESSVELQDIDIPESTVDLHTEELSLTNKMQPHEILQHQLNVFQQKLDAAIATDMLEITFIHGSGNGTLKSKIQKELSQHPHVAYYQDAQKSKFGYGATYVKIK